MVFVPFVYVSGVHLDVYYNRDVSVIHPVHGAINLCLFLGTLPTFFTNQRLLALQTISFHLKTTTVLHKAGIQVTRV